MNTSWKQICTCKSHNIKRVWNKKISHNHITATLPQSILQLHLHFSCTLYIISNLRFTKIRVSWNGELPRHQGFTTFCYCRPHYFYLYEVCGPPILIWAVVICSNIYNIFKSEPWTPEGFFPGGDASRGFSQIFFKGAQKWWSLFFTPRNWKTTFFANNFTIQGPPLPPFRRSWSEWRSSNLTRYFDVPHGPNLNGAIVVWPGVDLVCWNFPKFFQFMETFLTSPKFEWSSPSLLKIH